MVPYGCGGVCECVYCHKQIKELNFHTQSYSRSCVHNSTCNQQSENSSNCGQKMMGKEPTSPLRFCNSRSSWKGGLLRKYLLENCVEFLHVWGEVNSWKCVWCKHCYARFGFVVILSIVKRKSKNSNAKSFYQQNRKIYTNKPLYRSFANKSEKTKIFNLRNTHYWYLKHDQVEKSFCSMFSTF